MSAVAADMAAQGEKAIARMRTSLEKSHKCVEEIGRAESLLVDLRNCLNLPSYSERPSMVAAINEIGLDLHRRGLILWDDADASEAQ